MEAIISDLVSRFEKGALSRRGLVQGLAMLAATGAASSVASAQEAEGLKGVNIDHISIQVSDLPRAVAFYEKVFGLKVLGEDKPNEIARLGASKIIVSLHQTSTGSASPNSSRRWASRRKRIWMRGSTSRTPKE